MSAFFKWLIGIPEYRYEIKETIEHAQVGERKQSYVALGCRTGSKKA